MRQDPYGNISAGSERPFHVKALQINHSSDYFLYIKVLMLVGPGPSSPYRQASRGCI
jgi:hypothetical protein